MSTNKNKGTDVVSSSDISENPERVKNIIDKGDIDVNSVTRDGKTLASIAVEHKQSVLTQYLIKAGADVNAKSEDGSTPLHEDAERGGGANFDSLRAQGARVAIVNKDGKTPLDIKKDAINNSKGLSWVEKEEARRNQDNSQDNGR